MKNQSEKPGSWSIADIILLLFLFQMLHLRYINKTVYKYKYTYYIYICAIPELCTASTTSYVQFLHTFYSLVRLWLGRARGCTLHYPCCLPQLFFRVRHQPLQRPHNRTGYSPTGLRSPCRFETDHATLQEDGNKKKGVNDALFVCLFCFL